MSDQTRDSTTERRGSDRRVADGSSYAGRERRVGPRRQDPPPPTRA